MSSFLKVEYQSDNIESSNLFLTSGATHGLHLLSTTLLDLKNAVAFVENPTYFLALDVLSDDLGMKIVPFEQDLLKLEQSIVDNRPNDLVSEKYWGIFYLIPTFHNPTGTVMSESKMSKIVELATKYQMLIICDDVYNLLYYDNQGVPSRMAERYKSSGNVISNCTFSKIYCPG